MTGIELGFVMGFVTMLLAIAQPLERTISRRHGEVSHMAREALRRAFPAQAPTPAIEELGKHAEEALDADDLTRGLRAVSGTYDEAGRRE